MTKEEIQKYLCDWSNEMCGRNDPCTEELAQEILLYESQSEEELERLSSRWWDELVLVGKFGEKYFSYCFAHANRDESVFDLGWEFDWDSVIEVEPYIEVIEVKEYREKK